MLILIMPENVCIETSYLLMRMQNNGTYLELDPMKWHLFVTKLSLKPFLHHKLN